MSYYTDSEITKLRREIEHNRKEIDSLIELLRKDRAEIERLRDALNQIIDDRGGPSGNERKRNIARAALEDGDD